MKNIKTKSNNLNVIFLGDHKCGKTSIIEKFTDNKLVVDPQPTIGLEIKKVFYNGFSLNIIDTPGLYEFKMNIINQIKESDIIFLVFDLSRLESFNKAIQIFEEIKKSLFKSYICLLGNKADLDIPRDDPIYLEIKKIVDYYNFFHYAETSVYFKGDYFLKEIETNGHLKLKENENFFEDITPINKTDFKNELETCTPDKTIKASYSENFKASNEPDNFRQYMFKNNDPGRSKKTLIDIYSILEKNKFGEDDNLQIDDNEIFFFRGDVKIIFDNVLIFFNDYRKQLPEPHVSFREDMDVCTTVLFKNSGDKKASSSSPGCCTISCIIM